MIKSNIVFGRLRLTWRWLRFISKSICYLDFDFVLNTLRALILLLIYRIRDFHTKLVECNICGWQGAQFYPNVGPGYFERTTTCPNCLCQDRHRSLIYLLENETNFFEENIKVLEVAPMRSFEQYCREKKQENEYQSFDYERYAMEKGDITCMTYQSDSYDFFLCLHVMEHIQDEKKAFQEIRRVLKPSGTVIFQVPLDWNQERTIEYNAPKRRETGHVRMYGKDFPQRLDNAEFTTKLISIVDVCSNRHVCQFGLSVDPFFISTKSGQS